MANGSRNMGITTTRDGSNHEIRRYNGSKSKRPYNRHSNIARARLSLTLLAWTLHYPSSDRT